MQELVAAFSQAGYSLILGAPINVESYWQIDVGTDVLKQKPVSYPVMRVHAEPSYLPVYASVQLLLRDWSQYAGGIAFSATSAIERALNAAYAQRRFLESVRTPSEEQNTEWSPLLP